MQEAKNWPEGRTKIHMAVSRQWLEWAEEENTCQSMERAEGPGPLALSQDSELSARPGVQCESNVEIVNEGRHLGATRNTSCVS